MVAELVLVQAQRLIPCLLAGLDRLIGLIRIPAAGVVVAAGYRIMAPMALLLLGSQAVRKAAA